jgi:hypothetical protein
MKPPTAVELPGESGAPASPEPLADRVGTHIRENCGRYFGQPAAAVRPFGMPDVDYWSIIHTYAVETPRGKRHTVYCKMPRSRRGLTPAEDLTSDPGSGEMARVEFESLRRLSQLFQKSDPSLGVIRPLDLLGEPSAVLSEGVPASTEVFLRLRQADKVKAERPAAVDLMRKCGRWLAHLHRQDPSASGLPPMPPCAAHLEGLRAGVERLRRGRNVGPVLSYIDKLRGLIVDGEEDAVYAAEGFEVRNFIVSGGAIYFLDPGRMSVGPRYEDLARFLASLAILYWGQLRLLWKTQTEDVYARGFLDGYQGAGGRVDARVLSAYLVKRYLELWYEGLEVLELKRPLPPLRWFGRRVYLPRFFCKRIDAELARLGPARGKAVPVPYMANDPEVTK